MPFSRLDSIKAVTGQKYPWAKIVLVSIFAVIMGRMVYLQLIRGQYYWNLAESNRIQEFFIKAPRGRIYSRQGEKLVGNQPMYALLMATEGSDAAQRKASAQKIADITGRPLKELLLNINAKERHPFGVVEVISNLSSREILIIEEHSHYLPNLFIEVRPRRRYPYGENGAHLFGYIREISRPELARLQGKGFKQKDLIGKTGIEKSYDSILRGSDGFKKIEVGVKGKHRKLVSSRSPQIGDDIILTVDWELQQAAYDMMGTRSGAVIAMNPQTGEILTWLSKPGYNPEDFTLPISRQQAESIFNDPLHPLFDRNIQGEYPPGSLFKIVTALAALESGKAEQDTEYECNGLIRIGYDRKIYRCWQGRKHGILDLKGAITNSCNVYFYQLGMAAGGETISNMALKMGFAQKSQDIFSYENTGLIPTAKWKSEKFKKIWYPGDDANLAIGQGYVAVNPLQLLKAFAAVAASGNVYAPRLVKMILSPEGDIVQKTQPKLEKKLDIGDKNLAFIRDSLREVAESGTARYLNLDLDIAAKTGTAENPHGEDHAWFAAFAPVDDPQIAIVVLIENGGYGAVGALPVAREMLKVKFRDKLDEK